MARIATAPPEVSSPAWVPSARQRRLHSASLALAASVVMALAVGWQLRDVRAVQLAEQARIHTQLALALEITSERLGMVQQRIEQYQSQENTL
jgi:cytochrome c peroxidase